jgi:hypothetical protein
MEVAFLGGREGRGMDELAGDFLRLGFLFALWGVAVWIGGASIAAWVAWEKGREPVAWFVIALFLSPLVGLVALSAVSARHLSGRRERRPARPATEDPAIVAARLVNGLHREDQRWDVATSAATATRKPW